MIACACVGYLLYAVFVQHFVDTVTHTCRKEYVPLTLPWLERLDSPWLPINRLAVHGKLRYHVLVRRQDLVFQRLGYSGSKHVLIRTLGHRNDHYRFSIGCAVPRRWQSCSMEGTTSTDTNFRGAARNPFGSNASDGRRCSSTYPRTCVRRYVAFCGSSSCFVVYLVAARAVAGNLLNFRDARLCMHVC